MYARVNTFESASGFANIVSSYTVALSSSVRDRELFPSDDSSHLGSALNDMEAVALTVPKGNKGREASLFLASVELPVLPLFPAERERERERNPFRPDSSFSKLRALRST